MVAKKFGHTGGRTVAALYPSDVARLRAAARRIGHSDASFNNLLGGVIPLAIAHFGVPPSALRVEDLEALVAFARVQSAPDRGDAAGPHSQLFRLRQLLFQANMTEDPPPRGEKADRQLEPSGWRRRCPRPVCATASSPTWRRGQPSSARRPSTSSPVRSPSLVSSSASTFPSWTHLTALERHHVEAFLTWTSTRVCRRPQDGARQVGPFVPAHAAFTLRNFLDDIAAWGWAEAPAAPARVSTDIPRQPEILPRGLPPDVDRALMAAVGQLDDLFAKIGITVLRHTGLRMGELLDLEVDCIMDYGPSGTWLRVPLGKLHDERAVPLDGTAIGAIEEWLAQTRPQRALPHQRDGRLPRLRLRRPRPTARADKDSARSVPCRRGGRAPRPRWHATPGGGPSAPPYLGDRAGERGNVAAGTHGSARAPYPRDDDPAMRGCRLPRCEPPMTKRSARWRRAFLWHRPVNPLSPTASHGFQRRCSRPESRTGSAPESWPQTHVPMPTCARHAPTS